MQAAGIQRIRGKSKLIAPRNDACQSNWLFANHQDKGEGRSSVKQSIRETALWKSALEQARPIFIMCTVNSLNNRNFYEFQVGAKVHQWMTGVTEFIHQSLNYSWLPRRGYGLNTDQCWLHVRLMPSVSEDLFFWKTWQLCNSKKDALQKLWMGGHVSEGLLWPELRSAHQEDLERLRGSWKQACVNFKKTKPKQKTTTKEKTPHNKHYFCCKIR